MNRHVFFRWCCDRVTLGGALVRAADELHDDQNVSDSTWALLSEDWNEAQLIEIPFIVGQYTMLSMVAKATEVPIDPTLPRFPAAPAWS